MMQQHFQPEREAVVDIGINITSPKLKKNWRSVVQRAINNGVDRILLTGTSMKASRESLVLAEQWYKETGQSNLFVTIGIHPHNAKEFNNHKTIEEMKELLSHPLAVAVGECGLDYNRNFSPKHKQLYAFREQLKLACELNMPLFLHEREAHDDFIKVLDEVLTTSSSLPSNIVIHCFTGNEDEAAAYIRRGYYIGFTGTICMKDRGAQLRALLPKIPKDKIMVETDAPWMGFKGRGKHSEPSDCVDVVRKLGETINIEFEKACNITTTNAINFFRLPGADPSKTLSSESTNHKLSRNFVTVNQERKKNVVVGQTKSKSALRRERKALRKKEEEKERKALEEGKDLINHEEVTNKTNDLDPIKRIRKIKKLLRQIDELKQKDPSTLDEDQRKKVGAEIILLAELQNLVQN